MAQCLITSGWDCPDCTTKFSIPGLQRDEIFIANRSEVSAFTEPSAGLVSALTFDQYKGMFKLCVHKDTAGVIEELVRADNAGSHYTQTFTARVIDDSTVIRNSINDLVDVDIVVVVKRKNGKFIILGQDEGISLTENVKDTGATTGDDTGDLLTFTGLGLGKYKEFLDTDEATSQATLDGYVAQVQP